MCLQFHLVNLKAQLFYQVMSGSYRALSGLDRGNDHAGMVRHMFHGLDAL